MYQFSLRYFTQLFNATIENSTKSEDLNQRLTTIMDATTENIYTNVSRYEEKRSVSFSFRLCSSGLFEKDKLVFSFLLCAEMLKLEGLINEVEWNFLLRGGLLTEQVNSISDQTSQNNRRCSPSRRNDRRNPRTNG